MNPIEAHGFLNRQEIQEIFSNIVVLQSINKQILHEFETTTHIGEVFFQMVNFYFCILTVREQCLNCTKNIVLIILQYKYSFNFLINQSVATLEKAKRKNPKFSSFLDRTNADPRSRGLDLHSFLIKAIEVRFLSVFFKKIFS